MLPIHFFSRVFVLFYIFFEIKRNPANIGACGIFLVFLRLCKFAFYYLFVNVLITSTLVNTAFSYLNVTYTFPINISLCYLVSLLLLNLRGKSCGLNCG